MDNIERMYIDLAENGELLEIFPELYKKGHGNSWEEDKVKFTKLYKQINEIPNTDFLTFEEL